MIQVPETIKTLLHNDKCQKNIRIHFPNGERSDICNDLIVKDSVSFTESLCSQSELKFGLCESPIFECEVVGVGNIKGATIEVSCEIIVKPYWITSPYEAVFRPDLDEYVFVIPYGIFKVDSCQRQADMIHRKIVAYGLLAYEDFSPNTNQLYKMNFPAASPAQFAQNPYLYMIESLQNNVFELPEHELIEGQDSEFWFDDTTAYFSAPDIYQIKIVSKFLRLDLTELYNPQGAGLDWFDRLFHIEVGEKITDENAWCIVSDWFCTDISQYRHPNGQSHWMPHTYEYDGTYGFNYVYPNMSLPSTQYDNFRKNPAQFSRNRIGTTSHWYIAVCYEILEYHQNTAYDPMVLVRDDVYFDKNKIKFYRIDPPSSAPDFFWNRVLNASNQYVADYSETDFRGMYESVFETGGSIAYLDRNAKWQNLNIKQKFGLVPSEELYPGQNVYPDGPNGGKLLPQDYQSCWYDDEYTKPFGAVEIQYTNTNNEQCTLRMYLTGYDEDTLVDTYQVYYVNDNEYIKSTLWTQAQIEAICNTIANNISGVRYMPVEFTGRGLPYVEAGDTFEILTKSNDSITTIVLHRTLTGDQTLTDTYKSV